MNRRVSLSVSVIFILSCVLVAMPAYAYADPNTVGMLSQILTPLLIIIGASLTFLRQRIVALFSGVSRRIRRRADA
jgi:hypothetical protein